ncbi:tRNA methylation protein TRM732 [Sporobolomyces koalae]|uniref:tRNA methylation protein TRM732 n=1 Tax=Sporobolomyces koalae TaxID=500713 RepID=UPI00318108C4
MGPAPPAPSRGGRQAEEVFALRDRLVKDVKQSKKRKVATSPTTAEQTDSAETLNQAAAFSLVLEVLSTPPSVIHTATKGSGVPSTTLVAFEALEHLLNRAKSIISNGAFPEESDAVRNQLSTPFLVSLSTALYTAWDVHPISIQSKLKSCLVILLALAAPSLLNVPQVSHQLKAKILADPWNNKRSLYSFEALLPHHDLDYFAEFSASPGQGTVEQGIARRIVDGMVASEESAPIAGKVGMAWIEKCWAEQKRNGAGASQRFWIEPVLEACRATDGAKARQSICTYLFTPICTKRKEAFKELLAQGGYLFREGAQSNVETLADEDLEAALSFLRVGNSLSLVRLDSTTASPEASPKIDLPISLLEGTLTRLTPSLRANAMSLIVLASSTALPFPTSSFSLLKTFYTYSLGDEDGEFRMQTVGLTGKLLLRLRDSAWKAQRTANKGKDGAETAQEYVAAVKSWLEWWLNLIGKENLNPARPYRLKMNSLRMLDLAFQSRLDPNYRVEDGYEARKAAGEGKSRREATTGYSTYRKTPTTQTPMFARGQGKAENGNPDEAPWPFVINLVSPTTTHTLLRQLLSTYTAARAVCISTLERFPSPLPGYEGPEGTERAERELLLPALRMIRSGREADASAGAGIVGLVWRKWVLDSVEQGDASLADWTLGQIGGWTETEQTSSGPAGFAFLSSLLDLADHELSVYSSNLAQAASTIPMHGTILALRHLFVSIPASSYETLSTPQERKQLFRRALDTVKRIWDVTSPILAAKGLEEAAKEDEADTEEARAIRIERSLAETEGGEDEVLGSEAEGMGGPQYRVILSACWRSVKEASELLETLLRLPSELGTDAFRSVWQYDEICEMGDLFADWLRRIRHRGAAMTLHPCYARAAGVLLIAGQDWPELGKLPAQWLNYHLDSIVSSRISFTRRSAAIPYLLVGLLTTILPSSRKTFEDGFSRLFEIAESTSADVPDESRVHAMNTLRTAFLDAKCAGVIGPFVERAFLLSISLFWSTNWILRNVAMMLFSSLITRAFNARRTNLDRDWVNLGNRMTIDDFFGRYPTLKVVLRDELERGWKESLKQAPTSSLQSSIFAILMLISLLQTPNSVETAGQEDPITSLTTPFVPLVTACASSRVWKIRDAAGDALTGLVPPAQVPEYCETILASIERDLNTIDKNELHGRVGQVLRLLRSVPPLCEEAEARVATAYLQLATPLLSTTAQPFAVLSPFLLCALYLPSSLNLSSSLVYHFAANSLVQAETWSDSTYHLPSAEEYLRSCWQVLSKASNSLEEKQKLVQAALSGRSLEVKREAVEQLAALSETSSSVVDALRPVLQSCLLDRSQAGDVRISIAQILKCSTETAPQPESFQAIRTVQEQATDVPLKEALMPVLAEMADADSERDAVLAMVERWSRPIESVDSRESAALALSVLRRKMDGRALAVAQQSLFALCVVRLLQDDDSETREFGYEAARCKLVEGKAVEVGLRDGGAGLTELLLEEEELHFAEDLTSLSDPSSLLFAIEKPNIYRDDHLVPSILRHGSISKNVRPPFSRLQQLARIAESGRGLEAGPLGREGNEIFCRWATPLVWNSAGSYEDDKVAQIVSSLQACA